MIPPLRSGGCLTALKPGSTQYRFGAEPPPHPVHGKVKVDVFAIVQEQVHLMMAGHQLAEADPDQPDQLAPLIQLFKYLMGTPDQPSFLVGIGYELLPGVSVEIRIADLYRDTAG